MRMTLRLSSLLNLVQAVELSLRVLSINIKALPPGLRPKLAAKLNAQIGLLGHSVWHERGLMQPHIMVWLCLSGKCKHHLTGQSPLAKIEHFKVFLSCFAVAGLIRECSLRAATIELNLDELF
jgi:hypothetical protein